MRSSETAGSLASWRLPALALAGVGAAATGAAFLLGGEITPVEVQTTSAAAPAPAVPSTASFPRFDLVRVAPNGTAVLAGRAEPGARVTVRDGEREFGRTLADQRGYWMLMPAAPLPPGGRALTLSSRTVSSAGDGPEVRADGAVLLIVPEPTQPAPTALAVLMADQAPPRVLQSSPPRPLPGGAKPGGRLGLDAVDYGEQGDVRFAGAALPGAAVRAGVASVMASFNDVDGVPMHAHRRLVREVLKDEWGFDGVVVADWNGVGQIVFQGVATDGREAARLAMEAGVDIDMVSGHYLEHLPDLVRSGEVDEALLDDAVRRVLRLKLRLGLFDAQPEDAR